MTNRELCFSVPSENNTLHFWTIVSWTLILGCQATLIAPLIKYMSPYQQKGGHVTSNKDQGKQGVRKGERTIARADDILISTIPSPICIQLTLEKPHSRHRTLAIGYRYLPRADFWGTCPQNGSYSDVSRSSVKIISILRCFHRHK